VSTTATVVISILGFIAFFYVILYAGSYRMRRAATAFLMALVHGRHGDAHTLLTSNFQEAMPQEGFEKFLAELGITSIVRFTRSLGDFSIGTDSGSVTARLIREDGTHFVIELVVRREQMSWRIDSMNIQVRLDPAPALKAANAPDLNRMEVRVALSYWNAFRAQFRMMFYSPLGWTLSSVFPLAGCYMLYRWNALGDPPSVPDVLIALGALFFAPLYVALGVFLVRRNEIARGPFTYAFDSEGFHLEGVGGFSKSWAEMARVTESAGFLFVFVEPRAACSIPLRALEDAGCLSAVRDLVARQFRNGAR
jgi:hypothetical protein